MTDIVTYCDVNTCTDCPRYGDDCDGDKRVEHTDYISRADAKMTEEVREALMRLTMCAREECDMCKYKDKCGFEFQYNISTENMNTLSDALMRSRCEVDAMSADAVQGEWIDVENEPYCECSVCGSYIDNLDDDYAFCPRCGARMKGGDDE